MVALVESTLAAVDLGELIEPPILFELNTTGSALPAMGTTQMARVRAIWNSSNFLSIEAEVSLQSDSGRGHRIWSG